VDPVRAIDFANFSYPTKGAFPSGGEDLQLKEGSYDGDETRDPVSLVAIAYGDVTGDEVEDAMVVLSVSIRGSAIPYIVYVYTNDARVPKLLWAFETGDRGDGGLRQVYADRGALVVELYGKDKVIGKNLYEGDPYTAGGACCPKVFTRARYKWRGDNFQQQGEGEVVPNSSGNGSLIMPVNED
jgi:hypothetical protein